ncbi:MAG: T9SS type A sorting domain-containing protein [Flavobacteriales bacterium]
MKKTLLISLLAVASVRSFAQCPTGESPATMSITTDRYGEETTWSVTGFGGAPVYASGGPYTQQAANGAYNMPAVDFCVPDGVILVVTVNDAYGDGMCCAYGAGFYSLVVGGVEVATGGEFTEVETHFFQAGPQQTYDVAALTNTMEDIVAQGNRNVTGTLFNVGTMAITDFTLNYRVDGGSTVSQAVTANIAAGATYSFTHPTPWSATYGTHSVEAWASDLNGTSDQNTANDIVTKPVNVASNSAVRTALIEQFTSSTCPPCASLNTTFAPTLTSLNTNMPGSTVAAVKYHMNWPSPGNDPSYNPDGNTRKSYYGVTGIPDLFIDGKPMTSTSASYIQAEAARDAFVDLELTSVTSGNQVTATVTMTPYWGFTGTYKLHIAAVEDHYSYPASTTTQDEFHYVQRKMMPNASGNSLTAMADGVGQTVTQSYTFTIGSPAQGNYNIWGSSVDGLTLVAFVQNTSTKEVLQAATAAVTVGTPENELDRGLAVYPNPTDGQLNVTFDLRASGTAQIDVFNVLGERVLTSTRSMSTGTQRENFDMSGLNSGIYFVSIQADGMRASRKVTLN